MYTVKQIADQLSVTTETIRYYSRLGIIEPRRDPNNGYRYYSNNDISTINFILKAKSYGLTISEIDKIITQASKGEAPCEMVVKSVTNHYIETRNKIKELKALETRQAQALLDWTNAQQPADEDSSICALIEKS